MRRSVQSTGAQCVFKDGSRRIGGTVVPEMRDRRTSSAASYFTAKSLQLDGVLTNTKSSSVSFATSVM